MANKYEKALISFCISTIFILLNFYTNWPLMRYWQLLRWGPFIDTFQVIKSGECYTFVSLDVYQHHKGGLCHNYYYGRFLVFLLSKSQVEINAVVPIGLTLGIAILSILIFFSLKIGSYVSFISAIAVVFSHLFSYCLKEEILTLL